VIVTVPVPSSFAAECVTIGSYAGNATVAVVIVQFALTVVLT
jgi:hypothetical protein